jgi:hypothetical protein
MLGTWIPSWRQACADNPAPERGDRRAAILCGDWVRFGLPRGQRAGPKPQICVVNGAARQLHWRYRNQTIAATSTANRTAVWIM